MRRRPAPTDRGSAVSALCSVLVGGQWRGDVTRCDTRRDPRDGPVQLGVGPRVAVLLQPALRALWAAHTLDPPHPARRRRSARTGRRAGGLRAGPSVCIHWARGTGWGLLR